MKSLRVKVALILVVIMFGSILSVSLLSYKQAEKMHAELLCQGSGVQVSPLTPTKIPKIQRFKALQCFKFWLS
ncbi:hypothetical protein CR66_01660 [Campylobacter mucosalis]|nr:hypothetical protein CR66_01660 [Campylobacter mucosalis]